MSTKVNLIGGDFMKENMGSISEKVILEINQICNKYDEIEKVILFGSRAREDNHSRSDIDLAVYFKCNSNIEVLYELSEIETLLNIDITVISDNLEEKFLNNIEKDGIVLWENTKIN